jgi:hypothetical protein
MVSMDVVIHLLRCGLAIVLRCWGLSKVRCGGEGLVLHSVWQVLESAKDLLLGVDLLGQHVLPRVRYGTVTCAATCPVWNGLLNKLAIGEG